MTEENLEQRLERKRKELEYNSRMNTEAEPKKNGPGKWFSIVMGISMMASIIGTLAYERSQKNKYNKNHAQTEMILADSSKNEQADSAPASTHVNTQPIIQPRDTLEYLLSDIPESISGEYTITPGEYILNHDITVEENGKLTIMEGTTLKFDRYKGIYIVGGQLEILGTESNPIILDALPHHAPVVRDETNIIGSGWRGILIYYSSKDNIIDYAIINNVNNTHNQKPVDSSNTGYYFEIIQPGAITINQSNLEIDHSSIDKCATTTTGCVSCLASNLNIKNSSITNNISYKSDGGGINAHGSKVNILNSLISKNRTDGKGGGIYLNMSELILDNTQITGNVANKGGGIYYGDKIQMASLNNEIKIIDDESTINMKGINLIENNTPDGIHQEDD